MNSDRFITNLKDKNSSCTSSVCPIPKMPNSTLKSTEDAVNAERNEIPALAESRVILLSFTEK